MIQRAGQIADLFFLRFDLFLLGIERFLHLIQTAQHGIVLGQGRGGKRDQRRSCQKEGAQGHEEFLCGYLRRKLKPSLINTARAVGDLR